MERIVQSLYTLPTEFPIVNLLASIWLVWKEDHRDRVSFLSSVEGTYYQCHTSLSMLTLITWPGVVFVRFLLCKVTLFTHCLL